MVHFATPRLSSEGPSGASTPTGRTSGTSTPRTPRRSTAEDYFHSTMPATAGYSSSPAGSIRKAMNNCNFAYAGAEGKKETAVKENVKRDSLAKKIKKFINKGTTEYWDSPERSLGLTGALPKSYKASAAEKN